MTLFSCVNFSEDMGDGVRAYSWCVLAVYCFLCSLSVVYCVVFIVLVCVVCLFVCCF